MSLAEEDCNDKLDDLTKRQIDVLQEWEAKFQEKYKVVGQVSSCIRCFILSFVTVTAAYSSAKF